ncbi:MAG TPA: TonB-dependent receptor [Pseudomonadales bacterium]|nr:TonB-dependent receptor [Pseudomonadales bacterium]
MARRSVAAHESLIGVFFGCLLAPTGVLALDNAAEVETIVVTATRSERSIADQPDSVSVISAQQIAATPAQSLDDVMRTVAAVDLPFTTSYQTHPTDNTVSMRGLGGIRALVLLDGVPMNDPFFGYVQWSRVPMENVDRVEVVRGGGSPLWGNYAMGGVINVITRGQTETGAAVEAGYGSDDTYRLHADGYANATDTIGVGASVTSWGTNGFEQIAHSYGPLYTPTTFDAVNAAVTARFAPDASLDGYVRFNYFDDDETLTTPLSTNKQHIYDYSGSVTKRWGDSSVTATAFYEDSHFLTNNSGTPDGVATGFGEFVQNRHRTPVDAGGGSLIWSTSINDVVKLVSLGTDYQYIDGTDHAQIYDESGALVRVDVGGGKQRFVGVFGQIDVYPIERLEVLASVRHQDVETYDGVDLTPGGLGDVPSRMNGSTDPRVSLRYTVNDAVALRAAGYKSFRAPNLDNLYRSFSVPFGIFYPNSQLKPEKLKGGEGGFDVTLGSVAVHVTFYRSEIDDLLTYRNLDAAELPPGFFFGSRNINAGRASVEGAETMVEWTIADGWTMSANYDYARSKIDDNEFDPASVGNQQARVPRNEASGMLTYGAPRGWRASTRVRWVDKSWGDNANTLPLNAHTVVDASLMVPVGGTVEAFVEIQNLFDTGYIADNSGFNPPLHGTPFTIFGGVRVTLH